MYKQNNVQTNAWFYFRIIHRQLPQTVKISSLIFAFPCLFSELGRSAVLVELVRTAARYTDADFSAN